MNTIQLREAYERDGFVIIDDLFGEDYMAEIDRAIERYVGEVVPTLPPDRVFYETGGGGGIKSMNRMNQEYDFFADFKQHPKLIQLMAAIFNTEPEEIVAESLQYFGKPAFEGSITPWHQDNGFQQYNPPESLMIWLALRDVDEDMGCVIFAKGSHTLGVVPHVPSGVLGFSQTVQTPPDSEQFPEVKATMKRGSMSLHHCNTFHRSGPNQTERPRPALAVNYRTRRAVPDLEARALIKAEVARLVNEKGGKQTVGMM